MEDMRNEAAQNKAKRTAVHLIKLGKMTLEEIAEATELSFVKCKDRIILLTQHILPNPVIQYKKPELLKPYQVPAIDASDIVEKGAVKKLWHLHYAVDIFSLTCSQFRITGQSTGESLKNFTLTKGCPS